MSLLKRKEKTAEAERQSIPAPSITLTRTIGRIVMYDHHGEPFFDKTYSPPLQVDNLTTFELHYILSDGYGR
jgi:hypothetical protein